MAMEIAESRTTVHALLLSFPVPTHLHPLLQLARKLSSSSSPHTKFIFTSIVSLHVSTSTNATTSSSDSDETGAFTLRTIALPDGLPFSHPRSELSDMIKALENMYASVERFIPQLMQTSPRLSCIISDAFVVWAPRIASKFGIPLFSFFTSNATAGCVMSHAPQLVSQGIMPFQDGIKEKIVCPGVPPLLPSEFPPSMQVKDLSHIHTQFVLKMFLHLEQASGLILNSYYEIEPHAIQQLQSRCNVYTVGPLFLSSNGDIDKGRAAFQGKEDDECLKWLDSQASKSVLYMSFGTLSRFSNGNQMKELALGIEESKQPFLWVIRHNAIEGSLSDVLPDGFLENTKGRGFITSWAPQMQVLKHPSVGAFLSHCGWNSILENLALGGLPILCWPDKAEQTLNARFLIDVLKLGKGFTKESVDGNVRREEVKRVVMDVMQGEEGKVMRMRGEELKKQAENVVKPGGSTFSNLKALVDSMRSLSSD